MKAIKIAYKNKGLLENPNHRIVTDQKPHYENGSTYLKTALCHPKTNKPFYEFLLPVRPVYEEWGDAIPLLWQTDQSDQTWRSAIGVAEQMRVAAFDK